MAAARAAYRRFPSRQPGPAGGGVPTRAPPRAFTLLHTEADAFRAQSDALRVGTTLLVDTYDIARGIRIATGSPARTLGCVRMTPAIDRAGQEARELLDSPSRDRIIPRAI